MKSFYTSLSESLTRKYITEAWSDSMPDWVKKRLQATTGSIDFKAAGQKMINSKVYKKAKAQAEADGYDEYMAQRIARDEYNKYTTGTINPISPDYQSPRNDAWRDNSTKTLFAEFYNKGIDLSNPDIEFIEGDPPTSARDVRVQPPNIPIWRIPIPNTNDAQVYAKGINDLEKLYWNIDAGPYKEYAFKDISIKKISELCDHFCYIDGSTINYMDVEKVPTRQEYDRWRRSEEGKRVTRDKNSAGSGKLDKSGYIVIPPAEKYAEELKRLHAKNYAKKLTELEASLNRTYSQFTKSLNSLSFDDMAWSSSNRKLNKAASYYISQFTNYFENAVDNYKDILKKIDSLKQSSSTEDEFLDGLARYDVDAQITRAYEYVTKAVQGLGDLGVQQLDF